MRGKRQCDNHMQVWGSRLHLWDEGLGSVGKWGNTACPGPLGTTLSRSTTPGKSVSPGVLSKKFLHRAPWQRSFPQRNVQWQGKQFWPWILSTPVVCLCMPSQTCSAWSAKFCYRWFNYTFNISWKYMDTQDCYRAITTEDNQCHKGNSWYRSIYENIVA